MNVVGREVVWFCAGTRQTCASLLLDGVALMFCHTFDPKLERY